MIPVNFKLELEKSGATYIEYRQIIEKAILDYTKDLNERNKGEIENLRTKLNNPDLNFSTTFEDVSLTLETVIANVQGLNYVGVFNKPLKKKLDVAANTIELKLLAKYGIVYEDATSEMLAMIFEKYKVEVKERFAKFSNENPTLREPAKMSWIAGGQHNDS